MPFFILESSVKSFDRKYLHKPSVLSGFPSEIVGFLGLKLKAIVKPIWMYYFDSVIKSLNTLKTIIALIAVVLLNGCAEKHNDSGFLNELQSPVNQIVGGTELTSSKLIDSLFVLVVSDNNGTPQICTGTFITPKHILTAAHCVIGSVDSISLVSGVKPLDSEEGATLTAIKIDKNVHYNEKSVQERNDIAIITIAEEVKLNKNDFPKLPSQSMIKAMNQAQSFAFMAVGYGKTTSIVDNETRTEGILRAVHLQTSTKSETVFNVDQSSGKGVCYGDSGGPALKNYKKNLYLLGIASGIYDVNGEAQADECKQGALYMNIAPHIAWIKSVIE
ncbi:hypothetical protein CIK05_06765 [Bdellovibrio sp. qaytius]|nr:hypothetical protein CIK05_06765 [Bdellovibrio sp. qaytius]